MGAAPVSHQEVGGPPQPLGQAAGTIGGTRPASMRRPARRRRRRADRGRLAWRGPRGVLQRLEHRALRSRRQLRLRRQARRPAQTRPRRRLMACFRQSTLAPELPVRFTYMPVASCRTDSSVQQPVSGPAFAYVVIAFCQKVTILRQDAKWTMESVNHTMRPAQGMALVTQREAVMGACLDMLCKCADVRREALTLEVLRRSVNQTSNLPKIGSSLHQARLSVPGLKTWIAQRPALFQVLTLFCPRAALQSCTTMHQSCAGFVMATSRVSDYVTGL